jgi:hypothetical protein
VDIGHYLRRLWRLRIIIAAVTVVGLVAGLSTGYDLGIVPPKAKRKVTSVGTASTQMLVDSPRSPVGDLSLPVSPLSSRASLYAAFLRSEPVRAIMVRRAGLPLGTSLTIESAGSGVTQTTQKGNANGTVAAPPGARIVVISAQEDLPLINFRTQAPTADEAVRLANAATASAREYIKTLQNQQAVEVDNRIDLRPIGPPLGTQVKSGPKRMTVLFTGIVFALGLWGIVLLIDLAITRFRESGSAGRRTLSVES